MNHLITMLIERKLLLLLCLVSMNAVGQIKVEVSETVELMAILSRTAGLKEYSKDLAGQYTKDTEAWFASYKEHPIISYYQGCHDKYDISYDAVMSMAVHLNINKGKVVFVGETSDLEKRWKDINVDDFVGRLNQFYKDTRFHDFFEQHRSFYEAGMKSFEENVMQFFHQEWYARFYGTEPTEQFRVIVGFTYGDNNNGVARQLKGQPKEVFAICGYQLNATSNRPYWDASILIHEFNHSFVNPLLDNAANVSLMQKWGMKLLQFSQPEMVNQAYVDWETVINESVVRAAVIIYLIDHNLVNKNTGNFIFNETWRCGFRWLPELVTSLRYYSSHREQYKTLGDYYPEIARCLAKYLEDEVGRMQNCLK